MSTRDFIGAPCAVALVVVIVGSSASWAGLSTSFQFVGKGNWSIDGVGSVATPTGTIDAFVPAGSFVERAFLYSATVGPVIGPPQTPTVNFDGTIYLPAAFTFLGSANGGLSGKIQAYRADVTNQARAKIGGGSGTTSFVVQSETPTDLIDGEVLAVVYSNPGEVVRTIALLDGFSATTGDGFIFTPINPLPDPTTPGFEALLSLGISFSAQAGDLQQRSEVSVNGRRLTSAAGGHDDGVQVDGGLLTVGDLGDSSTNPADPFFFNFNHLLDDESYNLALGNGVNPAPFINTGATSISVTTLNPSNNDNIFFTGFNITAAGVVPEPGSIGLIVLVVAAAVRARKLACLRRYPERANTSSYSHVPWYTTYPGETPSVS